MFLSIFFAISLWIFVVGMLGYAVDSVNNKADLELWATVVSVILFTWMYLEFMFSLGWPLQ